MTLIKNFLLTLCETDQDLFRSTKNYLLVLVMLAIPFVP